MRLLLPSIALVFAVSTAAQVHSSPSNTYGSTGGWGSVAFPGTGHPPAGGYTAARPVVSGNYGSRPFGGPQLGRNGQYPAHRHPVIVPYVYAYPVYTGGYYDAPPAGDQSSGQFASYTQQPAPPTVIINQNFGPVVDPNPPEPQASNETLHIYEGTRRSQAAPAVAATDPQYYLIAMKDHTIYSALAYWVEDSTLHYVTSPNMHNQVSLDLIDSALTLKLNDDRGVPVTLAPAH